MQTHVTISFAVDAADPDAPRQIARAVKAALPAGVKADIRFSHTPRPRRPDVELARMIVERDAH